MLSPQMLAIFEADADLSIVESVKLLGLKKSPGSVYRKRQKKSGHFKRGQKQMRHPAWISILIKRVDNLYILPASYSLQLTYWFKNGIKN